MSSIVNKLLLNKSVSSFHAHIHDDDDFSEKPITASSALKASRPLVFPSPDFKLDEKEDAFLKDLIYQLKLLPNLSLLDLLFYDLHSELTRLKHCMRPEDSAKELRDLEDCYANLVDDPKKAEALQSFLKSLIYNVIVSNNKLRQPSSGSVQQVKAVGDTKLITATLHERVQLFQKFAAVFVTQPQFINHRLALLGGNEKLVGQDNSDLHVIFGNNSEFLELALRALSRTNRRVNASNEYFSSVIKKIKLLANPLADIDTLADIQTELLMMSFLAAGDAPPCMVRIFCDSFTACTAILVDTLKNFASMRTEELDRGFQVGKPPNMTGRSREPLDPKDKLSEFKVDHLVEPYFHLTDAESELIQELFETIHLDSEMTMFDILGFAFHERLESLKEIRPQFNDRITRSQCLLSAYCLRFYIGLQRSMPQHVENLGAINAFTRKFAFIPDQFLERVDSELRQLQEVVEAARIDARKPTPGQIKMLKESKEKVLAQITQTIIPIRMLFGKLLQCKGHYHLFLKSAAYYQGFEPLDHSNKAGRAVVVRYFDYVKSGFQTGVKEQLLGMGYDFDAVMKKELPFSNTPREKEMVAFGTKIASALYQMDKLNQSSLSEMREAISQELDHQTWLVRRNLQSHSVNKTPEEFREQLFSNYALTGMLQAFLSDMLRLVEQKVYPKGTITTEACAFRLVHNMHMYMNMKKSDEQTPPSALSRTTSSKFKAIVDRIEEMFTQNKKIFDYSIDDQEIQEGFFNHADWLGLLRPIEASVTALLDRSLGDLRVLKGELIQELKAQWSARSLEELQKLDVPAIKEAIFQEGLKLMRPLWILSDMLAVLQMRHYSEEAAIIPRELAEVMELDEIDEMLQKLIQDKTPAPPKPVAVEVAIEKPIPAPLPATQGEKDEKPALERPQKALPVKNKHGKKTKLPKAHPVVPPAVVPMAPAPVPEEVQELAHLTKSRQILDRLQRMGFYEVRTRGSHHIMSGPEGGRVVVPENDDLPRGTRNGIVNQTAEAISYQPTAALHKE